MHQAPAHIDQDHVSRITTLLVFCQNRHRLTTFSDAEARHTAE